MRRAYPTSFCFQEMIEIILKGFFTASPERVGHPEKLNQLPGVDVLEWYHQKVRACQHKKRERVGHPPTEALPLAQAGYAAGAGDYALAKAKFVDDSCQMP
jgi:hypothetical protein